MSAGPVRVFEVLAHAQRAVPPNESMLPNDQPNSGNRNLAAEIEKATFAVEDVKGDIEQALRWLREPRRGNIDSSVKILNAALRRLAGDK